MRAYLNVPCPVCLAPRDEECRGFGVGPGLPHLVREDAASRLEDEAIERAVDDIA